MTPPPPLQVVGGPHCGRLVRTRPSGAFVWVTPLGPGVAKATVEHRDGAEAYRACRLQGRGEVLLYVGHLSVVCASCGAIHRKAEGGRETPAACQLCGEPLARRARA